MKKILILVAILFVTATIDAQDYNRWAINGEIGNQMISDKTAVSGDEYTHFGLGVRYNLNEIVGVGITGGYDFTSLSEELFDNTLQQRFGPEYDFEYGRVNLEGYLNVFKAVDLYSKRWAVLFHGGTGLSFIKTNGTRIDGVSFKNNETVLNLRGGASVLFKISRSLAAYADFSTTSNVNQSLKFDGSNRVTNVGMSSNVSNISLGLTVYLSKKGKDGKRRQHADWYLNPDVIPTVNNYVTNHNNSVVEFTQEEFNEYYETYIALNPRSQYVFFEHDKYNINESELNAIYSVFTQLKTHTNWILIIKGWASPTNSSDEYNQQLSANRSTELFNKFVDMGIDKSRISFESYGKDFNFQLENVHDVARRVELIVKK